MGSSYSGGRRAVAAAAAAALTTVLTPASPASAGLLDPLAPVVGAVEGILGTPGPTGWRFDDTATTMADVRSAIGANTMWAKGYTGRGVGVALIDTGVVPVPGLVAGNVVNGADLSFESQSPDFQYLDTFGHGTHMAGIIAGNDTRNLADPNRFRGVAPDAKLTSIKVGASDGAVDVSQVIAAVDWVVKHRNDDPKNPIRVLNLSYGTDGVQKYELDPLTHAVENAWRAGIVVVVSGGNEGFAPGKLNNPAYDPHVLAVGAADLNGTAAVTTDDTVPDFSSRGDASRRVDVVAPGRSIVSLRDPGSYIDSAHPHARYGEQFFKGSGTSQAAAVVSGAVALLLQQRPSMTPNQVKALLRQTASPLLLADAAGRGQGEINLTAASITAPPSGTQSWAKSTGLGSLEAARGTNHVADGNVELTGEKDILGPWNASKWAPASTTQTSWVGGKWNGRDWTGDCYCADTWSGKAWSGRTWKGLTWSGETWTGRTWKGRTWKGDAWADGAWAGRTWKGENWSGENWS